MQDDRQRVYLERLARIQEYLTSGLSIEALEQQGKIRPIFPEWVREQRLMASDFVSLTSLAYTFTAPTASLQGGLGSSKVMMYHNHRAFQTELNTRYFSDSTPTIYSIYLGSHLGHDVAPCMKTGAIVVTKCAHGKSPCRSEWQR